MHGVSIKPKIAGHILICSFILEIDVSPHCMYVSTHVCMYMHTCMHTCIHNNKSVPQAMFIFIFSFSVGVDMSAHLGGFLCGLVIGLGYFSHCKKPKPESVSWYHARARKLSYRENKCSYGVFL